MHKKAHRIGTTVLLLFLLLLVPAVVQADISQFTGSLGICGGVTTQELIGGGDFLFLNRELCQDGESSHLVYQFQVFLAPDPITSFSFGPFPANVPVAEFSPGTQPAGFLASDSTGFAESWNNGIFSLTPDTDVGTFPAVVFSPETENLIRSGTIALTGQNGAVNTFTGFEVPVQVASTITPEPGYFVILFLAVAAIVLFRYRRRGHA